MVAGWDGLGKGGWVTKRAEEMAGVGWGSDDPSLIGCEMFAGRGRTLSSLSLQLHIGPPTSPPSLRIARHQGRLLVEHDARDARPSLLPRLSPPILSLLPFRLGIDNRGR